MSKRATCRSLLLCGLVLDLIGIAPTPALAQDCGLWCHACTEDFYEGFGYNPSGDYNMSCIPGMGCDVCHYGPELVSDAMPSATELLDAIVNTSAADLAEFAKRYDDYLVLHPARNLIATRGTGCAPDAVTAVLFLDPAKTEALEELGVRRLADFYERLAKATNLKGT